MEGIDVVGEAVTEEREEGIDVVGETVTGSANFSETRNYDCLTELIER